MLKNQLKIAWRNLLKDKQQTLINLFGLTIGTVSCLLILLYVFDQMGYDQHHDNAHSIYRVNTNIDGSGADTESSIIATTAPPTAFALKEDFPEIEQVTRVVSVDLFNVDIISPSDSEEGFYESGAYLADSTFLQVFNYKLIKGNETSLNEPSTLILSSKLAKKLFGTLDVVDKTVEISGYSGDPNKLTVKGVFEENSGKSHLRPNYIISMDTPGLGAFVKEFGDFSSNTFVYTYIKLKPGANTKGLQQKLPGFLKSRAGTQLSERGIKMDLFLQPITDIHLHSNGIASQIDRVSNIEYLYILLALAFFIQLVACINFINLSTARANKRGKEIGVRKVVGAEKKSLVFQFLTESLMLSFFSVLLSIPITISLLPMVNELTGGSMTYEHFLDPLLVTALFSLGLLTGIIAGLYPALVLSSLKTVLVLKNVTSQNPRETNLRRTLVVFQFVLSIALISVVILLWQQFNFTQKKDLGFKKENLVSLELNTENARSGYYALKSEYLNIPGVKSITGGWYSPSESWNYGIDLYLRGKSADEHITGNLSWISEEYTETTGIQILEGRDLRENDENQVLVNQATVKALNLDNVSAIGTTILSSTDDGQLEFEIVGVVNDFHFSSLKQSIEPLILNRIGMPRRMILRLNTQNFESVFEKMEETWKSTVVGTPFVYSFVDKEVERAYEEEKRIGKIALFFTILAILISALGLFGLVSYTAEQKKKEIGIRKVLGASVHSVVEMLTKDFIMLVLIAFLVATPLAYLFVERWLEGFAYHIQIQWWVFALAGSIALIITTITVGIQSLKSAVANPAMSLRTE